MPVLVVEKGHCYRTSGSTGTSGEQDFATLCADAIYAIINGVAGWSVKRKLADSGSYSGNAFAAIHCDGSTNSTARGASVGFQSNEGNTFGHHWMTAYANHGWTGGFRPVNYTEALAEYYGVRNAINAGNRTAIIIESGFMTNPDDRALLTGPGGPERVAYAIADALGIPVEGSYVGWKDEPSNVVYPNGTRETVGNVQYWTNFYANMIPQLLTVCQTILANQANDLSAEDILAHLDQSMTNAIRDQVVPALRSSLEEVLQDRELADAEDVAEAVIHATAERLALPLPPQLLSSHGEN